MNSSTNVNMEKDNKKKKQLLPMAVIAVGVLLFFVSLFINHRMSVDVSEAKVRPKIEGQTELVLNEGYDETETSAYTVQGGKVSIVSDTTDGKAVWNEDTSKLLIQRGLTANASVTLEVSNGNALENATITLYITITHNPCIKGPKECFLEAGYQASQSGVFAVYGKNVSVTMKDESETGLVSWNDAEKKLDIAPGLRLGTYKIVLVASNGDAALDSVWECVITVGKQCLVTGSYAYSSGTYVKGVLLNSEDKVTVKIGDYVADVDVKTRTYECLVPNGYYDVVFSSELFADVKMTNVHITNNTKLEKVTFNVPNLTPDIYFEYADYEKSGVHYTVWIDRAPSPVGMTTDKGFTVTVSMRPFNYEWGLSTRGSVGVKVGDRAFYIMPRFDSNNGNKISIYVTDKIVELNDVTKLHCLGDTGQVYTGNNTSGLKCTMQLTYLNGNYYVSLTTEGCQEKPNVLVLNQSTSGLGAEYFGAGKRTVQLASLKDFMYSYSDFSYAIGDEAAKAVVGGIELCTIEGAYSYASGTYTSEGYRNSDDKVRIQIGHHQITPDVNTQTYKAVIPKGTYDVTLSSKLFRDVTVKSVKATGSTNVPGVVFTVPKMTPTNHFEYSNYVKNGMHYTVWKNVTISPVDMKTDTGFTATVSMRPFNYEWGLSTRGSVGVKVGDREFYIMPRFDSNNGNKISIYVTDKIVELNDVTKMHCLGDTGQTYTGSNTSGLKCTMQLTYLNGNYYVSLTTEGCREKPNVLVLNQSTSGLGAEYFGAGKRTVQLASLKDFMYSYSDFSYAIGDEAAKAVVGDIELCTIEGTYSYASGTYTSEGYRNSDDKVRIQIGHHQVIPDVNTQTYKAVIPKGTYDVTLTSDYFRDVTLHAVDVTSNTNVLGAAFTVPKMTPAANFEYSNYANSGIHYTVWKNMAINPVGMKADDGFTATVSMRPFNYEWGLSTRGSVGVKVGYKTFYIMPRFDSNNGNKVFLYVTDRIVGLYDVTAQHCLGDTGQTYTGSNTSGLKCTMQLTYLNGNYYVSLTTEGCTDEPNVLILNQSTSGLGAEYFGAGTRTLKLVSLSDYMYSYGDLSYAIGDEAAKAVVGDIELCTIEGAYSYKSGTYTAEGYRNSDDKVRIQIGHHQVTPDVNTQTYKAVIPKGTYDVTLTSDYFRDVTLSAVDVTSNTNVPGAAFTVPKMTPAANFEYSNYTNSGIHYTVWQNMAINPVGMKADDGFAVTITMRPLYDWGYSTRGNLGVKVGDKTFYIMPRVDTSNGNKISLYVTDKIVGTGDVTSQTCIGDTRQTLPAGIYSKAKCTMQLIYLDGSYYVSLSAEGCSAEPQLLLLNQQTTKLGAEYFAEGTRTLQLASLSNQMMSYGDLSYELGNVAAQQILYEEGFVKVTGMYSYTSGTYEENKLTNEKDSVVVKIGAYGSTVDTKQQTYEAVVPKDTYDITFSSSYFQDVKISSVEVSGITTVPEATFTVAKMTPSYDFEYSNHASSGVHYNVWENKGIAPSGMKTDEAFTATVSMRPTFNWGYSTRGNVSVKVGDKAFYLMPRVDFDNGKKISIYLSEKIEWTGDVTKRTCLGDTGQIFAGDSSTSTLKCTMTLTYLNGNYYITLTTEGCTAKPKTLLLNEQTSGLGAEYFEDGTRNVQLASLIGQMNSYGDFSYKLGKVAAEEALYAAGYRKITGTVRYPADNYNTDTLKQDKVAVKIGNYAVTVKDTEEVITDIVKQALKGKYVSILGDSLSTYTDISNSGSPNTTTAENNSYYGNYEKGLTDWTQTYWGQIISKYEMKLLVNNSCGGNRLVDESAGVPAGYLRAGELAANTGDLNGQVPDVIFMHMGTNDYIGKVDRAIFREAYEASLDTFKEKYPNAQVYCFTLTPSGNNTDYDMWAEFNQVIREVVSTYENVILVDVATESSITTDNYNDYTFEGTHYNATGMLQLASVLEKALTERHCSQPIVTYEAMVDENIYDIVISSEYFEDVIIEDVKVQDNITVPEVQFVKKKENR